MAEKQIVPSTIRVVMPNGRVQEMKLETYLAGAVAMAIGTSAPLEALKAQAVASRTYAARAKRHSDLTADVCTTVHCQKWKRVDPIVAPEVFRAVSETWGTVALHAGELIEAFFFEHCSGKTRDAEDLAMPAFPYLTSVDCKCGFTEMKGHGIGMCQRGAIVMARQGSSFKDILTHYYQGVEIVQTRTDAPPVPSATRPSRVKKAEKTAPKTEANKPKVRAVTPDQTSESVKAQAGAPVVNLAKDGLSALIEALNQAAASLGTHIPHEAATPRAPAKPATRPKATPPPVPAPIPSAEPKATPISETSTPSLESILAAMSAPAPEPSPAKDVSSDGDKAEASPPTPVSEPDKSTPVLPQLDETIHVDMLPGPRVIAGCLQHAGLPVEIEDMRGHKTTVYSGSAPHYGEGGFEAAVEGDGFYTVSINGKIIEVNVRGETAFLRAE